MCVRQRILCASVVWVGTTSLSLAFVPKKETRQKLTPQQKTVRVDTIDEKSFMRFSSEDVFPKARIDRDAVSGAVRLVTGGLTDHVIDSANTEDYVAFALEFADRYKDFFGVASTQLQLHQDAVLITKDVQFFRFNVTRDGVRIEDANVDFRFKRGVLVQVQSRSFSEAAPPAENTANLDWKAEVKRATGADWVGGGQQLLRVQPTENGYALVSVLNFTTRAKGETFNVQIDTHSGKIFELKDNRMYAREGQVKADLYPRYWGDTIVSEGVEKLNIQVGGQTSLSEAEGYFNVPNIAAGIVPKIANGLTGPAVVVKSQSNPNITRDGAKVGDLWQVNVQRAAGGDLWKDKDVAQGMIFRSVNEMVDRAKRYVSANWLNATLTANANLNSYCNAYWDGSTINLFSGDDNCANTGLITDVVYHEWGHGLDANTGGIQDGAFSEGFGDIVSMVMTRSPILGIGFRVSDRSAVRDLEPDKIYPRDRGEVHDEGLIIAGTFWDLYKALRDKMGADAANDLVAKYAFRVIFTASTYLDVYEALLVIDDDDTNPGNGTPHACVINAAFAAHGLAQSNPACVLAAVEDVRIQDTDSDGVLEPGESARLQIGARNFNANPLSGLMGDLSLVNAPNGIAATQPALAWDTIAGGGRGYSSRSAEISIGSDVACGTQFAGKLHLYQGNREVFLTQQFSVGRNLGQSAVYNATGLPLPIQDMQTTRSVLAIGGDEWSGGKQLSKAKLKFDIRHTYIGDVSVTLTSPAGTSKQVFAGRGSTQDAHIDMDISALFEGEVGAGNWTLAVLDNQYRDEGTLDTFQLTLTPKTYVCD